MKAVREEEVKYVGVRFVKHVGFKAGVKEKEGVMDAQSGETEEEKVMGEGIGESEKEELYQNEVDEEIKRVDTRVTMKHTERSDQCRSCCLVTHSTGCP